MQLNRGTINGAVVQGRYAKFHIFSVRWLMFRQGVQRVAYLMQRVVFPFRQAVPSISAPQKQDSATAQRG